MSLSRILRGLVVFFTEYIAPSRWMRRQQARASMPHHLVDVDVVVEAVAAATKKYTIRLNEVPSQDLLVDLWHLLYPLIAVPGSHQYLIRREQLDQRTHAS